MKKNLICTAVLSAYLLLISSFAAAVEYGGKITDDSKLKTNNQNQFKFDQANTASLWIKAPVIKNQNTDFYVTAQGTYGFEHDFNTETTTQYLDLELFKGVFNRQISSYDLGISAGRFSTRDLTGNIFSQKADGLDVSFNMNFAEVKVFAAYTGLLNGQVDVMLDQNAGKVSSDTSKIYQLAQKNLVGIAYVKFPALFLQQNLALQGTGAFSLENKPFNRLYATLDLSGPVIPVLYYEINTTFGFTQFNKEQFQTANLSSLSLTVFPPVFESSVSLNAVYASGNQGSLKPFCGITSKAFSLALDQPEYSGMAKTGISLTAKPVSSILISGSFDLIFNAAAGDKRDQIKYKGLQFTAGVDWQIVSDCLVGLKYSQYNDKDNININRKQIALTASLNF